LGYFQLNKRPSTFDPREQDVGTTIERSITHSQKQLPEEPDPDHLDEELRTTDVDW
jgi:hypothetical protein